MTPRIDREIRCLRQQLQTVALRKFPWCGAPDEQCRREAIRLAMKLRHKYQERYRV